MLHHARFAVGLREGGKGLKDPESSRNWPPKLRLLILLGLAVALIAPPVIWREELMHLFANRERIVAEIRAAGAWGPLVVIGLIIAQTVVAPIPGQMVNLVAGYVYGLAAGLLYSWSGQLLGAALAMGLARAAGRPLVERLAPRAALDRLDRLAARQGWRFFFLVFLIPGLPDDLFCFVAGLTRLPLRLLIALSATARLPGLLVSVWLGAYAEEAPWQAWAAGGLLAAVGFWVAWRYGQRIQDAILQRLSGME